MARFSIDIHLHHPGTGHTNLSPARFKRALVIKDCVRFAVLFVHTVDGFVMQQLKSKFNFELIYTGFPSKFTFGNILSNTGHEYIHDQVSSDVNTLTST